MYIEFLLDTVTVAPGRPQGREAHVGAALALCWKEIDRCGVVVTKAYSEKGVICIEIERGPICRLEVENWQHLLQTIARNWNLTAHEPVAEFQSEDGWFAQEVAHPSIF